jgi:hypothetical protein
MIGMIMGIDNVTNDQSQAVLEKYLDRLGFIRIKEGIYQNYPLLSQDGSSSNLGVTPASKNVDVVSNPLANHYSSTNKSP